MIKIGIICGGPSPERGISLNSARSLLDHIGGEDVQVISFYVNTERKWFLLESKELYSNTPSDFDFKLARVGKMLNEESIVKYLKKCDIVYPTIHGTYGEDGELQAFLEKYNIPYVGTRAKVCKELFDKYRFNESLKKAGFYTVPTEVLKIYHNDHKEIIDSFFRIHKLSRAIIKPASSGSSIGVFSVNSPEEALEKVELLFSKRMDTRVVIQPYVKGNEFTVIILQNQYNIPVAILPTEIIINGEEGRIFDYRKKYLPTRSVTYHCPPRFSDEIVEKIRIQGEQIFSYFAMQDIVRIDGWILDNGSIWFADFNPVSGMEQNSFLFQQGSRIGFSHSSLLWYTLQNSAKRQGITLNKNPETQELMKKSIGILMGGETAERQVSLMSGTNVWLKLKKSKKYTPIPYLMKNMDEIWRVPYPLLLNHTVEEIIEVCKSSKSDDIRIKKLIESTIFRLAIPESIELEEYFSPYMVNIDTITEQYDTLFLALHGGIGEDGTLQDILDKKKIRYNGSNAQASRTCMDKYKTGEVVKSINIDGIRTAPKVQYSLSELYNSDLGKIWKSITDDLSMKFIILKPSADGCSAGVVLIKNENELVSYINAIKMAVSTIPAGTLDGQDTPIEMPSKSPEHLLFESYIQTDDIHTVQGELKINPKHGWIEVTVGVLEKNGVLSALEPSMTVTSGTVLSVEEKFQGGTGINITPLPESIIDPKKRKLVKERIGLVANALGIRGYARIDAFVHRETGEVIIIEANSLPALTPSTVLFHQGLAENPSIEPRELLERII